MSMHPESESLLEGSLPSSRGGAFHLRTNQDQAHHNSVTKSEAYTREPRITVVWLL